MFDSAQLLQCNGISLSSLCGDRRSAVQHAIEVTSSIGGEIWECGCWRGGTSLWIKGLLMEKDQRRTLRLFDTFAGLPYSGPEDKHPVGAMAADETEARERFRGLTDCYIRTGIMPATFAGLEESVISVAYIDVDQYRCVKEVLEWVYPRVHSGGYIFCDDYNCGDCPGAKRAMDEFLRDKPEQLVAAGGPNPQAHFIKL